jgi:hypothetical protein
MTTNRSHKQLIRSIADQTGRSYVEISRLADTFDKILDEHPRLTSFGMGIYRRHTDTAQQRADEFDKERTHLRNSLPIVITVALWLTANIGMIKTPTRGSYGLKHLAESSIGHYVTNGQLIAAALIAGYPMREAGGPNPLFGMRKRDLDRAEAAVNAKR